jgi:hypothetical protein
MLLLATQVGSNALMNTLALYCYIVPCCCVALMTWWWSLQ